MLSDDVSAGVSEWGCVLSLRAVAEGGGEFVKGWIVEKDFREGKENVRGYSALPGDLLFVRECAVTLLCE